MDCSVGVVIGGAIIGTVVGLLTGIFGVGGGFLMTPALMIFLGISGNLSVGTGLATILVNSSLGIAKRAGSKTVDVKLAAPIAFGSIFGVIFGSYVLNLLKDAPEIMILGKYQDPVEYPLLILFLILLGWIAGYLFFDYKRNGGRAPEKRIGLLARVKILPYMNFASLEEPRLSVTALFILGLAVGILTGFMGTGGGVILLPALVYLVGQRTSKAAGTSLLLVCVSSLIAVLCKMRTGDIDISLLVSLLVGGIGGTFLGTKIGLKMAGPKLRLYFVYIVISAIALIGYKIFRLTF